MSGLLKPLIAKAADGPLTREEAEEAFGIIMSGEATMAQAAGLLMALRTRGETVDEIAGAAAAMRGKATAVRAPKGAIDIVGTGGDGRGTLNISTAAAFIVAGAGVPVAKHGNRALTSQSGTADALSQLGINVMVSAEVAQEALDECGICFMMAPTHHSAMKHVMPVRLELGTRTVFNILGPLTNPAGVKRQLTGAYAPELLRPMAETLKALGSEAAWLVHGADGTDEISIAGPSSVVALENGEITEREVHPEEAGLPIHPFREIIGGLPEENAFRLRALLNGTKGAYRDAALLNSAAALLIAERAGSLKEGAEIAAESIDSGAARAKVTALAAATHKGA